MRFPKLKLNKKGETLVEMIISFALLALFLSSAVSVMSQALGSFQKVKSLSYAQNVGDMIIEKVGGELSKASDKVLINSNTITLDGKSYGPGEMISFTDSHASPIVVYNGSDSMLCMHYRVIRVDSQDQDSETLWPAVDWKYDERAYQQMKIVSLSFEKCAGNTVKISVVLHSDFLNHDYSTSKTIECYNLGASDTVGIGTVYADDDDYYDSLATP